jgi:hypothetical protein
MFLLLLLFLLFLLFPSLALVYAFSLAPVLAHAITLALTISCSCLILSLQLLFLVLFFLFYLPLSHVLARILSFAIDLSIVFALLQFCSL